MKLILKENSWSNPRAFFLESLFKDYFELTTDLTSDGLLYVHWPDYEWAKSLNRPGIVDHLWEPWENPKIQDTEYLKVIRSDGWFAIANECLWYKALGYDSYRSTYINDKTFIMTMNKQKPHRDLLWDKIQPHLTNAIYSYQGQGVELQGAIDINQTDPTWQRHFNSEWYDHTRFSLVVESELITEPFSHSEKGLKPMAFRHPFVVWGPSGYLEWLRVQGFVTFDHIIDERYDLEKDNSKRLEMVIAEVARLNNLPKQCFQNPETELRLDYNQKRFYNTKWALEKFEKYFDTIKQYSHSW